MARVVLVHGIGQQYSGPESMLAAWLPPLQDGLTLAQAAGLVQREDVAAAFYGDLFRPPGRPLSGVAPPPYTAADVTADEAALLMLWWAAAAEGDPAVVPPAARTLGRTPASVQAALRALSGSRFFAGLSTRMMIADLKQVSRYFGDDGVREQVGQRLRAVIGPDTAVVVAHSLGSVAAYETLCALAGHPVRVLVTLGSPLGIANVIFERLRPAPDGGLGRWPGAGDLAWHNIADAGDVVALVKDLRGPFGPAVRCHIIHNGSSAHAVARYLNAAETGAAVAAGVRAG
ncbi:hypothetical protein [Asanoa iriomotensis]|uniref:Serine peptidase n=1 Tax=Asanoa iriomotensis TaxID=234613 RepID=A0ABQ4CAT2_9ACTN|nr:hypothetical protein [Asanoa iriomotensis]GIF59864.1 hypothetical protein Air01nite_59590 [Asanoa iriomotensis]